MSDLVPHALNLLSNLLDLLSVLMHESIKQNLLFDLNPMQVLEWLIVLIVKSV